MAGSPARTLVVYWNPYGRRLRLSTAEHLEAVCRVGARGEVIAVNAHGGVPRFAVSFEPTAIVLHTTFLAIRWLTSFNGWRERSAWLGDVGCPVLALPQDDFDHSDVLDEWLEELGVSTVFSALPDHADVLYPRTSKKASIVPVLTGYIARRLEGRAPIALAARPRPIVYRATRLPYWFGRLGQLKAEVGAAAMRAADQRGIPADISMRREDAIMGRRWLEFLESGRVVVGAESGSSVIDHDGSVRRAVRLLLAEEPRLGYDDVVARLPGMGWDDRWLGVVSPRHLEAALTRTAQVLVEGTYSGVLEPHRHYIPVTRDLSNVGEALEAALDPSIAGPMVDRAYEELVASGRYRDDQLTAAIRAALPGSERAAGAHLLAPHAIARAWNGIAGARAAAARLRRAGRG